MPIPTEIGVTYYWSKLARDSHSRLFRTRLARDQVVRIETEAFLCVSRRQVNKFMRLSCYWSRISS